jgi:hypothetical protein
LARPTGFEPVTCGLEVQRSKGANFDAATSAFGVKADMKLLPLDVSF